MPTNANTFNSRVTSEALEAKFRQVFPAQGGAELVQDLFASGVIQPIVDFSSVAQGSILNTDLQTAWDLSTGHNELENANTVIISNPGFWLVDCVSSIFVGTSNRSTQITLSDGLTNKIIYKFTVPGPGGTDKGFGSVNQERFVVFIKAGETLSGLSSDVDCILNVNYRQIADVYGNLVNPLGFTFS